MADKGKDITDPAKGIPETRGGENPSEWTGPLPDAPPPEDGGQPMVADPDE